MLVKSIPNYIYDLTSSSCTNGATIDFNENTRKFTIKATDKTVCEVEFTKKEVDIILNLFKEDVYGSHEYNGVEYKAVKDLPGSNYTMVDGNYYCLNQDVNTIIIAPCFCNREESKLTLPCKICVFGCFCYYNHT